MLRKLTEREHIIQRPAMYIGAMDETEVEDFHLADERITYTKKKFVPGLIKAINEIIDNSVDVAIKTKFKSSNQISVTITKDSVTVTDNGTGIPIRQNEDGLWLPELAWGHARAGSNFDDDDNRDHMGMNGVGSFATNCFSKRFTGTTDDGQNKFVISFVNNAESFTHEVSKPGRNTGTTVEFEVDLEKFGLTEITKDHIDIINHRLVDLKASYPKIKFKLNNKNITVNTFKKYVELFSEQSIITEMGEYRFAIIPNESDEFKHFTYLNGLKLPDGGTHIDYIMFQLVDRLRNRIAKKYKNIKPADIKNKLTFIGLFTGFKNPKFNSQAKEKITNTWGQVNNYLGDIDYDGIANQLFRTPAFIEPITDIYRIKEEFKRRQEMKGLKRVVKKFKSEKYLPSIGVKKYLIITEGDSANGGLGPALGRKQCGYYALKGKPLNAIQATHSKFLANKELKELYSLILSENYQYIIYGTDSDLDGIHIRGLLNGFVHRYLPELKGTVGILQTPVKFIKKKGIPIRWSYDLHADLKPKTGELFKYMKGLGTWDTDDLKYIVNAEGLEKMIQIIDFDSETIIDDWLGDKSDIRKEYIQDNDFNIAKL